MKRIATHILAAAAGVTIGFFLSGCASTQIRRLSGADFVQQAKQTEQISSLIWTTYIGSSGQRAYLELMQPALIGKGVRTTIFWTPLPELPDEVAIRLKEGNPPWAPWYTQTNGTGRSIESSIPK